MAEKISGRRDAVSFFMTANAAAREIVNEEVSEVSPPEVLSMLALNIVPRQTTPAYLPEASVAPAFHTSDGRTHFVINATARESVRPIKAAPRFIFTVFSPSPTPLWPSSSNAASKVLSMATRSVVSFSWCDTLQNTSRTDSTTDNSSANTETGASSTKAQNARWEGFGERHCLHSLFALDKAARACLAYSSSTEPNPHAVAKAVIARALGDTCFGGSAPGAVFCW
mmetsp:Transcript_2651/g.9306  ORF Transcript_2651/g.9306 Transcript_2651/m.9306 type:complete len:226 (-) Transcript_2651:1952-2629(-)